MDALKRKIAVLQVVVALLALGVIAIGAVMAVSRGEAKAPHDHYMSPQELNVLVSALYTADHPPPSGPLEAPAGKQWDADYAAYRRKVSDAYLSLIRK